MSYLGAAKGLKVYGFPLLVRLNESNFNFTQAAEHSNAENCLFLPDPALAATYYANWQAHEAHSALSPMVPSP